jgi:hypothetical protein
MPEMKKVKGIKVQLDTDYYIETFYKGDQLWDCNVVDDGDTLAYIVNYRSKWMNPEKVVEQLLNDTGDVETDDSKVYWYMF